MSKFIFIITLFSVSFFSLNGSAQENVKTENNTVKTGWNLGLLPAISYNS